MNIFEIPNRLFHPIYDQILLHGLKFELVTIYPFLCGGNLSLGFYIFFYMYTCHLNLFNHNFTAAARHASACGLATNVQTSMRNVKLYWINIDIFCVEHLKPIVFCYSLCLVHERTQHDIQYCKFHCLVLALLIALHGLFYSFVMHWKCFCKVTISSSKYTGNTFFYNSN